uniref:STX17-like N-terminal domain-containing protein n=1 Tax=Homalodisca liturata TaxID=320908 RepID=A0A1B6IC95_9HEMI
MYHIVCDEYSNEILHTPSTKTSVKWLEVPIQKFNCAVQHFVDLLKTHDANITKLKKLQQWEELQKELANALKTVNQLTYLLNDMDNLRNQVVDSEISKFDKLIFNSKQSALNAIKIHQDFRIRSRLPASIGLEDEPSSEEQDQKLQIITELSEDIKQKEKLAVSMEQLHQDAEDIQSLFQDLAQLVHASLVENF